MITAHDVATELRKLADSFDQKPEAIVCRATVSFYCDTKEEFLSAASLLPRPYSKGEDDYGSTAYRRIHLNHETSAMLVDVNVYKHLTCELVEPAKPAVYRCDPILSAIEEVNLEAL